MAFASAAGHGNLPNGNFSPIIYSKKAQLAFRKASVVQAITNTDYMGEISEYGDTVKIIKEPTMTVKPYTRGSQVTAQDIDDDEIVLTIDKANYFAFKVDDLEKKQSHVNFESLASDNAGYQLKDTFDSEVLSHMVSNANTTKYLGTNASPQKVGFATGQMTPLTVLNRMSRWMDENNVSTDGRWFVADPIFWELMQDEDSKIMSRDYADGDLLRNGQVTRGKIRGFTCYQSNNLPVLGSGGEGTTGNNFGVGLAGHMSSTATAEQINKTESYRDTDSFADVVRGLHMYGRKVLRPEALFRVKYNQAT